MSLRKFCIPTLLALALAGCSDMNANNPAAVGPTQQATITILADKPGAQISSSMWGAFFEDINFGGDGGLYAELVKNRGFEFPDAMMGWFKISPSMAKGDVTIETANPYRESQTHYARIASKADAPLGISNEGFRGIGVKKGELYDFSAQIRYVQGTPRVTVELYGEDGTLLAQSRLDGITTNWSKISAMLRPKDTDGHCRLCVFVNGPGTVDFDFVSLFPQKTWKNRPGGLRQDMVQALADMHPGFVRFPGGCIVEGSDLSKRYQWKTTIGPVEDRKLLVDRWNYEFKWRPTPDYYQSFGVGFFEFFQVCEDIGAQPLPLVNCGMACQFNSGELCPVPELGPFIQDALDLIEFANGPASSTWGAKRVAMGHPEPFNPPLKMIGIGNEQWGPQYVERLEAFTKAIKEKYPDVQIVSAAGPSPDDDRFVYLWPKLQQLNVDGHKADIADQHCYANPIWFRANSDRFDSYDRNGPKIFFGEYAAQSDAICSTKNRNNLECALAEAAFMTGLERNADVVRMASYAPLYSNIDAWQWTPDLIWTDSLHAAPSVNYYVQQLYCQNRGDAVLPVTNTAEIREMLPAGRVGIGTNKASAEFKDIKITRGDKTVFASNFAAGSSGFTRGDSWKLVDGVYQQSDPNGSSSSFVGDKSWTDYTVTLKARRTSDSGAIVITVCDDPTPTYNARAQWILGMPFGNLTVADPNKPEIILQTHYAEQDQVLQHMPVPPGLLEKDKWVDITISVKGSRIDCDIDNKFRQSAEILHRKVPSLFTSASRDEKTGETILKVVNPENHATAAKINVVGGKGINPMARVITLSGRPGDEDTLEKASVLPVAGNELVGMGPEFRYTFKPWSMTVIRLRSRSQ